MIVLKNSELFGNRGFSWLPQKRATYHEPLPGLKRVPTRDPGCEHGYQICHHKQCHADYLETSSEFYQQINNILIGNTKLGLDASIVYNANGTPDRTRTGPVLPLPCGAFGREASRIASHIIIKYNLCVPWDRLLEFANWCLSQEFLECIGGKECFSAFLAQQAYVDELKKTSPFKYPVRDTFERVSVIKKTLNISEPVPLGSGAYPGNGTPSEHTSAVPLPTVNVDPGFSDPFTVRLPGGGAIKYTF